MPYAPSKQATPSPSTRIELQNELDTFLTAYEEAINRKDLEQVMSLLAKDAIFSSPNADSLKGRSSIRNALEEAWKDGQEETLALHEREWTLATYWTSVCTYQFTVEGRLKDQHQRCEGHRTAVLRRLDGSWRILHEHSSIAP